MASVCAHSHVVDVCRPHGPSPRPNCRNRGHSATCSFTAVREAWPPPAYAKARQTATKLLATKVVTAPGSLVPPLRQRRNPLHKHRGPSDLSATQALWLRPQPLFLLQLDLDDFFRLWPLPNWLSRESQFVAKNCTDTRCDFGLLSCRGQLFSSAPRCLRHHLAYHASVLQLPMLGGLAVQAWR